MSKHSLLLLLLLTQTATAFAAGIDVTAKPLAWQQVASQPTFHFLLERELYTTLDRTARIVMACEGEPLNELAVRWALTLDGKPLAGGQEKIPKGGIDVTFPLAKLSPGNYVVKAELLKAGQVAAEKSAPLRYEQREPAASAGKVALHLSRKLPDALSGETWPIHAGVPFPKGALWDPQQLRVVDDAGKEVDADVLVRGRWDSSETGSIRWVGVQYQPGPAPYHLEYGPAVKRAKPAAALKVTESPEAIAVDTGVATLRIKRKGFNVIDHWSADGQTLASSPRHGLYVVDHRGTIYRAANDREVELSIEEQSAMHVVVRASGWYVKDRAANPPTHDITLPTDKLCRFITRIEAYAGKPYVRVMNTLIITFDTFTVRLRDAGMSLPAPAVASDAIFGIEDGANSSVSAAVAPGGVRGVQHLHNAFTIEDGEGKSLAEEKRSAGWVVARGKDAALALSLRDTWQRYPKEFEVLPDAVKLHVWPAHGRDHPQIDQLARNQIHKLLYAHQGGELVMGAPWDYFIAACNFYGTDTFDVYQSPGHVIAAVYASGMGVATTSDVMLQLGSTAEQTRLIDNAARFQAAPHAIADPKWNCDSLALGYIHPYDPATFPAMEQVIRDTMRGYWKYQEMSEMFGMWIYRSWLHSHYLGDGAWELARLYNGTHHQEAIIPWLLYARSGDPFYLTQGQANIRQLTDVQMIHHEDDRYQQKEFHSSQKQLIGSTRHDDCIAPYGNDHGILGHLCCYNAPITAYYLTGDLRLREVVVDEWQNTLLTRRDSREYAKADRSNTAFAQVPRDNSNAVAEILDVYQLTYDPRLLVLLAPRLDIWLNAPGCMGADWGQPLHNEQLFRGSAIVREKLLAGAAALRTDQVDYSLPITRVTNAPQELLAVAGIVDPAGSWAFDAVTLGNFSHLQSTAWDRNGIRSTRPFSSAGETVLHIPRMLYALARSSRPQAASVIGAAVSAPRGPSRSLRVVVREDSDRAFKVYFHGKVNQEKGCDIQVYNPAGAQVAAMHVPPGAQAMELDVPADGVTGQYVLFVGAVQKDACYAPFTQLPEVYVTSFWTADNDQSRFFTRRPAASEGGSDEPAVMTFSPHQGPGVILAADQRTTLAETRTGEPMQLNVGPEGVWIWNRSTYMAGSRGNDQPAILACSPQRWFMPDERSLALTPEQSQ